MTPPAPRGSDAPLLGLLAAAVVATGVIALTLFSRLPGPQPPGPFRQMLILHGSMAGQLGVGTSGLTGPTLHVRSQLEGHSVDSWLYSVEGQAATAHRLSAFPDLPRNAQSLPVPGGPVHVVDFDELATLCWADGATALCVVGGQPVAQLKRLVVLLRAQGPGPTDAVPAG